MRNLPLLPFILVGLMICGLAAADSTSDKPSSAPGQPQVLLPDNAKLKEAIASKDKELAGVKDRLTRAEADVKRLTEQNKEIPVLREKLTRAEAEMKSLVEQKKRLDEQLRTLQNNERALKDQISRLEKEKNEVASNLSQAKDSHGNLTKDLEGRVRRYKEKYEHYKTAYIAVSIVLYSLVSLELLLVVLFLIIRIARSKRKKQPCSVSKPAINEKKSSEAHTSNVVEKNKDELRCPMCGWRYNPGEKVCKNCRTQF